MLRANDIVPRNFELLERQETLDTPPASEMSSGKREQRYKVEKEVEFESDDDEDSMREKALLVRFRFRSKLLDSLSLILLGWSPEMPGWSWKNQEGTAFEGQWTSEKKVEEGIQASLHTWRSYWSNLILRAVCRSFLFPLRCQIMFSFAIVFLLNELVSRNLIAACLPSTNFQIIIAVICRIYTVLYIRHSVVSLYLTFIYSFLISHAILSYTLFSSHTVLFTSPQLEMWVLFLLVRKNLLRTLVLGNYFLLYWSWDNIFCVFF